MAHLPPLEVLFPLSDDVTGLTSCPNEICDGCRIVEIPLGYLSVRGLDFKAMDFPAEVTH